MDTTTKLYGVRQLSSLTGSRWVHQDGEPFVGTHEEAETLAVRLRAEHAEVMAAELPPGWRRPRSSTSYVVNPVDPGTELDSLTRVGLARLRRTVAAEQGDREIADAAYDDEQLLRELAL